MKEQQRNKAIQEILNIVKNKYPDFKSEDRVINQKMIYFLKVIKKSKELKTFKFVDYSISYVVRSTDQEELPFLAEDLLTIAVIFETKPDDLEELSQINMDNYVKLVRNRNCEEISKLNKIILNEHMSKKIFSLSSCFSTKEEYREYVESLLTPLLLRYRILKQSGMSKEEIANKLQEELEMTFNTVIELSENQRIQKNTIQFGRLYRKVKEKQMA